eukprot:SAG11_NODE_21369_length_426_cov_1.678899_1_plen_39_part_10
MKMRMMRILRTILQFVGVVSTHNYFKSLPNLTRRSVIVY